MLFQGVASTWDGSQTLPCICPSPALGEGQIDTCRLLSQPAAWGWAICWLVTAGGVRGEQQSNLLHCSDYLAESSPPSFHILSSIPRALSSYSQSRSCFCFSCFPPTTCCVFVYSVCVLCPLAQAPKNLYIMQESSSKNNNNNKKQQPALEIKLCTPIGLCSDAEDESLFI